ncbi:MULTISPECIES: PLDc N-terminal domain-containing protein [Paenibacillus]|uniref:PLDc N-terminal domain-containing protein n=1 Tax=Paenibacillus TaxID=44249 RepID=UPI002041EA21|nr:PLDc N-terminal domain-containing protein [Paenibacillus camelliae]MCM3634756.1 PLD nuclease N-terminal domain-containing protein [Paenibacillus camelliae]
MNELSAIPWELIAPILVIQLVLQIIAIIDLIRVPETKGPKVMWLLLILISGMIASIVYFIIGRKQQ